MSERINRERRRLVSRLALALTAARLGPVGAAREQVACAARPLAGGGACWGGCGRRGGVKRPLRPSRGCFGDKHQEKGGQGDGSICKDDGKEFDRDAAGGHLLYGRSAGCSHCGPFQSSPFWLWD